MKPNDYETTPHMAFYKNQPFPKTGCNAIIRSGKQGQQPWQAGIFYGGKFQK